MSQSEIATQKVGLSSRLKPQRSSRASQAGGVKNALLLAATGCLAAAGLWIGLADSRDRIPPGWSWKSSFVGTMAFPDAQTGAFPEQNPLGLYDREITIHSEEDRPRSVVLKDDLLIQDPETQAVTWRYTVYPRVDPATGRHLDPAHENEIVVFPRNVERDSYKFRMNYVEGLTLSFLREDRVDGLDVYLFGYKGRGEYTESYLGTEEYSGVPVNSGQEIKCADDQFSLLIWVEPLTGEAVKVIERCDSGDYVFDISTGSAVSPVLRWGGETTGRDVLRRAEWVREERLRMLAAEYMPYGLACLGIGFAGAGLARRRASA